MTGSGTDAGVFDPGLQPERTALAWRRAALALLGGSLLLARLLSDGHGPAAAVVGIAVGAAGLVAAIATLVAVERRYRSHHRRLIASGGRRIPIAGGALPLLLGVATVVLGLGSLVAVVALGLLTFPSA